jgi:hypothetical protein
VGGSRPFDHYILPFLQRVYDRGRLETQKEQRGRKGRKSQGETVRRDVAETKQKEVVTLIKIWAFLGRENLLSLTVGRWTPRGLPRPIGKPRPNTSPKSWPVTERKAGHPNQTSKKMYQSTIPMFFFKNFNFK